MKKVLIIIALVYFVQWGAQIVESQLSPFFIDGDEIAEMRR